MRSLAMLVLFSTFFGATVVGQTIVSTSPQTKNAVIEEFGGIYCAYCTEGHQIIHELKNTHPDKIVHLNYQIGDYAAPNGNDPDFRTTYGEAILEQSGTNGYPSATINRNVFYGLEQGAPGTMALSRWNWTTAVEEELNQDAIVNLAATASVNISTHSLEILVEYYYTGNSVLPMNKLQIAIMQNEVLGPQVGGNQGNNYTQDNMFRTFLTGQWGESISQTSAGTFGSRTFSYQLPDSYRDIPFDPFNIKIAIFISEDEVQILNGIEISPGFQIDNNVDAHALWLKNETFLCQDPIHPIIKVRNEGNYSISSFVVDYNIGLDQWQYHWNGTLPSLATTTIDLPPIPLEDPSSISTDSVLLQVTVSNPNESADQNPANNSAVSVIKLAPQVTTPSLLLSLQTDQYGYETYWEILNEEDEVIYNGGNPVLQYTSGGYQISSPFDEGIYGDNQSILEYIDLPQEEGCYKFRIIDDYGDGMCCNYGWGYYALTTSEGNTILAGGAFGAEEELLFNYKQIATATNDTNLFEMGINLSPVPVTNGLLAYQIQYPKIVESYSIDVFNLSGQILFNKKVPATNGLPISGQLSIGHLPNGLYLFRIKTGRKSQTKRFIIAQ